MLIRTQNMEGLIDAVAVYIVWMNNENRAKITGDIAGQAKGNFILGYYADRELATNELDDIMTYFLQYPNGIYQMK